MTDEVKNTTNESQISESEVPANLVEKNTETTNDDGVVNKQPESDPINDAINDRNKIYNDIVNSNIGEDESANETKDESTEVESADETDAEQPETDELDEKIQKKIEKRIGKEVAKRKSAEEELAELKKRLEEIESNKDKVTKDDTKDADAKPTMEQIKAAYKKAIEDGDFEYAANINEYWMDRKAELILEQQQKKQEEATKATQEEQRRWQALVKDYVVYEDREKGIIDNDHPLNLNNQQSALFKTAMKYFNDKELSAQNGYNKQDRILGFRLAVNDAYRDLVELAQEGKLDLTSHKKSKPKDKLIIQPKKRIKSELADSSSEGYTDANNSSNSHSTMDLAQAEIDRRNKQKQAIG